MQDKYLKDMKKWIIDRIAICQWVLDYRSKECQSWHVDYLDLDNDITKLILLLDDVLNLIQIDNEERETDDNSN